MCLYCHLVECEVNVQSRLFLYSYSKQLLNLNPVVKKYIRFDVIYYLGNINPTNLKASCTCTAYF